MEPELWLDMAVTACQRGEYAEMNRLLSVIESRFNPPPGITTFINGLRQTGCKEVSSAASTSGSEEGAENFNLSNPQGRFSIGFGSTSNANLGPETQTLALPGISETVLTLSDDYRVRSDQFLTFGVEHRLQSAMLRNLGLDWGLALTGRAFKNESEFSDLLGGTWLKGSWPIGPNHLVGSGISFATSQLAGQAYANYLRWSGEVQLLGQSNLRLNASDHRVRYAKKTNFDSDIRQLGIAGSWTVMSTTQAEARMYVLSDNAKANRPGGDRKGWGGQWVLRGDIPELDWQASLIVSFEDTKSDAKYSPGLIDEYRNHESTRIEIELIVPWDQSRFLRLTMMNRRERDDIKILGLKEQSLMMDINFLY